MIIRFLVLLCLITWAPMSASAAEFSRGEALGFSEDGKYFAWEEYGYQDGSGTPYLTLYVLDVAKDSYAKGFPRRLNATEDDAIALENASRQNKSIPITLFYERYLQDLRTDFRQKLKTRLDALGPFIPTPPRAINPPFQRGVDAKLLAFNVFGFNQVLKAQENARSFELRLDEFPLEASVDCSYSDTPTNGFSIGWQDSKTKQADLIANDTRIPKSRGCPKRYALEAAYIHINRDETASLAVLVRYTTRGFEGDDGRLLAVTARLPLP